MQFVDDRVFVPEGIGCAGWFLHSLILLDEEMRALLQIAHNQNGGHDSLRSEPWLWWKCALGLLADTAR
jgi:hypothetical protein